MPKSKNKIKSSQKSKASKQAVRTSGLRITNHYLERSRFPLLPREIEFALTGFYHDQREALTTQSSRITPLCEFNTQLPRFGAEFYQIYRHARIMAIDIQMEVVNLSTEPLLAALGCLPLVNANAITNPQTIISVPGTVYKQVGSSTGASRIIMKKRFVTEKMLGELTIGSQTYLQTYSEALSSAIWTELPAIYAGVIAAKNGATWSGIVDYRYTYHIRWSEYSIPSLGLSADNVPHAKTTKLRVRKEECMDDDCDSADEVYPEWVMAPPKMIKKKGDSNTSKVHVR